MNKGSLTVSVLIIMMATTMAYPNIEYDGNVTDWPPRKLHSSRFRNIQLNRLESINGMYSGSWGKSIEVTDNATHSNGIWGVNYVSELMSPAWNLIYWKNSNDFPGGKAWVNIPTDTASEYIAAVFESITVVNEFASQRKIIQFDHLNWKVGETYIKGGLRYTTFSTSNENVDILMTFVISNVVGKINYNNAIVSPLVYDAIVDITHKQTSIFSHMELTTSISSGIARKERSDEVFTIRSGSNPIDPNMYYSVSRYAEIDGELFKDVEINVGKVSNTENLFIEHQITSLYTNFNHFSITSSFPNNASHVVYTYSMGHGLPLYKSTVYVDEDLIIILACVFGALVIIAIIIYCVVTKKEEEDEYSNI
eukprot:TRINITY_DN9050_c0_g1_i1.p1 TRINITY_DN9050_c0_g1~~TRINITY_DN9050_c0_g1_i1.p1  ORF type:complete len:366 (+),score=49.84 TRINITY_DN9050_c0_g1_i1:336-1433(+)